MFMIAILVAVVLIGGVVAYVVQQKNQGKRAGQSGRAEVNKQTYRDPGQDSKRAQTGSD